MSCRKRRVDIMAGSERMLKAHHKNAVFLKSLEKVKLAYDEKCTKNLGKMQQGIYEVYFDEYLPLKGEVNKIRQRLPELDKSWVSHDYLDTIPVRPKKAVLPKINPRDKLKGEGTSLVTDTENYLENLREKAAARKRAEEEEFVRRQGATQPLKEATDIRNGSQLHSRCSGWPDSVFEGGDETPRIDARRLHILKTAIALTSQPAKPPEVRKPRRLRKSFLLQLRRQSKQVWENELLQRVFAEKHAKINTILLEDNEEADAPETIKWRPSLSKNRIFNCEDDDEEDDMEFYFADRASRASVTSVKSDISKVSVRKDIPVHDIEEDLYHPESSPELFSVISEHSESFYSGSSYTTGSDYSYYSSETDY